MRKALAALVLLLTSHCVTPSRAVPPPAPTVTGGRCGATLGPIPFKNPKAVHLLVADFHGASSPEANFSKTVSAQVTRTLESFKEETLRNPKKMDLEVPEGFLEIARLSCFLDNHEQAEAVARALDADVVLWGQAFCNLTPTVVVNNQSTTTVGDISTGQNSTIKVGTTEVQAPRPYTVCPKATLYRSERSLRRGSERGMDLASLGHLDLPALSSTEPFLLIHFALGLHFYELKNYWLAARFFKTSAEHVLATERNVETLDLMLGQAFFHLPDLERSLFHSRRALERIRGSGNEMEGVLLNNIGLVLVDQGEYARGLEHFRRALAFAEKALGKDHPEVATVLNNIGGALKAQGEYAGALEHFSRALAIDEKALGKNHPTVAAVLNNIGRALHAQGEYAGALEHYRRALAIADKALGKDHPTIALRLNNIGGVLHAQGEYAGALEHFRRALAIAEKALGKEHPTTQGIRDNLAQMTALKNARPSDGK